MSSIVQNHPESNTKCYKVAIPYGNLHLVVDGDGSRWTSLAHLADLLHLQMHTLVDKTDKKYWMSRCFHLPSGLNGTCIPIDRITSLLDSIKDREVVSTHRTGLQWLRANAYGMLNKFQAPIPVVPLLDVEPEPAPVITPAPVASTGLQTFNFGAAPIRVVMREGEPWWMAADVCTVLDLGNPRQAITRLDDDEKSTVISNDGGPDRNIVSESGLYSLVLGSRKPEAKAFKRWITHEVIPAIRKTGGYGVQTLPDFSNPAAAARAWAEQFEQRQTLACKVEEQTATISLLEPKANGLDIIATTAEGAHTLTESAKILQQPPRKFVKDLERYGWIYRTNGNNAAYQDKIRQGLMEHKYVTVQHNDGPAQNIAQPLITPKGLTKLAALFGQAS